MTATPRVSIVVTTFNGRSFADELVRAVQAQIFSDFECLIIDDGSTDGTRKKYLAVAAEDARFRVPEYRPKGNAGFGRQFGVQQARGELVAILDHDDLWHPTKLAKQVAVLDRAPEIDLVCTRHRMFPDGAMNFWSKGRSLRWRELAGYSSRILKGNHLSPSSFLFRKSSEERIRGFVGFKNLVNAEDYYSILHYIAWGRVARVEEVLTFMRTHGGNKSQKGRLRMATALEMIAQLLTEENFPPHYPRKVRAQACKTRAGHYLDRDPLEAWRSARRAWSLDRRWRTLLVLVVCGVRMLTSSGMSRRIKEK